MIAGLVFAAIRRGDRRAAAVLALIASFLIALSPSFSMGVHALDLRGERFLYLPSVYSCMIPCLLAAAVMRGRARYLWWAAMTALLFLSAVSLRQVQERWIIAGRLSREIARDIVREAERSKVLVLNVPDHFRGAYVYRANALPLAVQFASVGEAQPEASRLSAHSVSSLRSKVELRRTGTNGRHYELQLERNEEFLRVKPSSFVELEERTRRRLLVRLKNTRVCPDVFYFSQGAVHRLSTACPRDRKSAARSG